MKKILVGCLGVILFIIAVLGFFVYYFFFSFSHLPEGEFLKQVDSPDKTYTIRFYLINGGATTSFAIRGELINNQKKSRREKNIYWDYRVYDANVIWLDNNTVVINGHKLNVEKDTYDWRRYKKNCSIFNFGGLICWRIISSLDEKSYQLISRGLK